LFSLAHLDCSEIGGIAVEAGFFAFEFMGGSMGSVVGEKIARQFERAVAHRRPAVMPDHVCGCEVARRVVQSWAR